MNFDDHRTTEPGGPGIPGGVPGIAESAVAAGAVRPSTGGGTRYGDEAHATRSRRRTYLQPVGAQFDRHLLR